MAKKTMSAEKRKDAFSQMIDKDSNNNDDEHKSSVERCEDANTWQSRYDIAYRNEKPMKKKWAEWYEMMYAIKNEQNIGAWKSQVFIPVMSYKAWTIISKLIALRPGFSVKIYDELYSDEDRSLIEKANIKLEYDYDNPMLEETIRDKEFDIFTDATVCGTGFGKAEWVSGTRKTYKNIQRDDGTVDYTEAMETETEFGYNDLDPLNAFDVFGAPGGRNWEGKPWIIAKYHKTRSQLIASELYDEDMLAKLKPLEKNRDPITKYKQSRNQFIGATSDDQDSLDDTTDSFNIFECYEKTPEGVFLMTYAEATADGDIPQNKVKEGEKPKSSKSKKADGEGGSNGANWYEIRNERQPYWHNKYPIVPAHIRRRPHDCWGESIFEITESMANAYNDIFNQLADNLSIVGNGGILMHNTATTIYDFYYAPGGEVRYSGDKPEFETPETPDMQIFNQMFSLLESGVTNATVSPYASGVPADGTDQTQGTATGINALQEAAGEITAFMKGSVMQFVKGVGERWLSNNRQFFDDTLTVKQKRRGQDRVLRITSEDFLDTMVMDVDEASMQPPTTEQRREGTTAWLNSLITVQNQSFVQAGMSAAPGANPVAPPMDPATQEPKIKPLYLDLTKIAREVSEDYDKPDIDEFILDEAATEQKTEAGLSDLVAAIREQVKDGSMEGDEAQQIIDALENRPSPLSQEAAETQAQALITQPEGEENEITEATTGNDPSELAESGSPDSEPILTP